MKRSGMAVPSTALLALVDALDNYIRILGNELNDCVTIAHVHGWRSTRVAEGEKVRKEIAALRRKANAEAHGRRSRTVQPLVGHSEVPK